MTQKDAKLRSILTVVLLIAGCGTEVGNPKKPTSGGTGGDEDIAKRSEVISAELDDTMSVIASESADMNVAGGSFNIADPSGAPAFDFAGTISRTCQESSDRQTISGTVTQERSANRTIKRRQSNVTAQMNSNRTTEHLWTITQPSASLTCTSEDKIRIPWLHLSSATLNLKIHRESSRTLDLPISLKSKLLKSRKVSLDKEATILHTRSDSGGVVTIEKSMTFSASYAYTFENGKGTLSTRSTQVSSMPESPIVTRLTFANDGATSRTIVSGTQKSVDQQKGTVTTMSFANLAFSNSSDCLPESGTITGQLFDSENTEQDSFTITFANGEGTIRYTKSEVEDNYTQECMD